MTHLQLHRLWRQQSKSTRKVQNDIFYYFLRFFSRQRGRYYGQDVYTTILPPSAGQGHGHTCMFRQTQDVNPEPSNTASGISRPCLYCLDHSGWATNCYSNKDLGIIWFYTVSNWNLPLANSEMTKKLGVYVRACVYACVHVCACMYC